MRNQKTPKSSSKKKRNANIPSVRDVFNFYQNKNDWWLPFSSNCKTKFKLNTQKLADEWAETETPKQF